MLSAANLNALEDAGFGFIVGSRITKAPYDLAEHFTRHGDYFADGQILESSPVMGSGKHERRRRGLPVVVQAQPAGQQDDQRADRSCGEGHRRQGPGHPDPVPEGHRRHS